MTHPGIVEIMDVIPKLGLTPGGPTTATLNSAVPIPVVSLGVIAAPTNSPKRCKILGGQTGGQNGTDGAQSGAQIGAQGLQHTSMHLILVSQTGAKTGAHRVRSLM